MGEVLSGVREGGRGMDEAGMPGTEVLEAYDGRWRSMREMTPLGIVSKRTRPHLYGDRYCISTLRSYSRHDGRHGC